MMYPAIGVHLPEKERIPVHPQESKYKKRSYLGSSCDPQSPAGEVSGQGSGWLGGCVGGRWEGLVSRKINKMVLS